MLRHTYTSNLLSNGAAPKDVQELIAHADVSTKNEHLRSRYKESEAYFCKTAAG